MAAAAGVVVDSQLILQAAQALEARDGTSATIQKALSLVGNLVDIVMEEQKVSYERTFIPSSGNQRWSERVFSQISYRDMTEFPPEILGGYPADIQYQNELQQMAESYDRIAQEVYMLAHSKLGAEFDVCEEVKLRGAIIEFDKLYWKNVKRQDASIAIMRLVEFTIRLQELEAEPASKLEEATAKKMTAEAEFKAAIPAFIKSIKDEHKKEEILQNFFLDTIEAIVTERRRSPFPPRIVTPAEVANYRRRVKEIVSRGLRSYTALALVL